MSFEANWEVVSVSAYGPSSSELCLGQLRFLGEFEANWIAVPVSANVHGCGHDDCVVSGEGGSGGGVVVLHGAAIVVGVAVREEVAIDVPVPIAEGG